MEFLETLVAYIKALNTAAKGIDETDDMHPHVNFVPVMLLNELTGFIKDEIGGAYSYSEATEAEREWWENRPWANKG